MKFDKDFTEFIIALNQSNVEYILVGGYAVIYHGYDRTTGDLDIWVNRTNNNYDKLMKAFSIFGLPLDLIEEDTFINNNEIEVYTFGKSPVCIDIMTQVKGLNFNECYPRAIEVEIGEGNAVKMIDYRDLIAAKKASGRHKDLDDLEQLS